jgi:hypothetical protein
MIGPPDLDRPEDRAVPIPVPQQPPVPMAQANAPMPGWDPTVTPIFGARAAVPPLPPGAPAPVMPTLPARPLRASGAPAPVMKVAADAGVPALMDALDALWAEHSAGMMPVAQPPLPQSVIPPATMATQAPTTLVAPSSPQAAAGHTPRFTNPMPGAPNPLGAGTLAYGGMRAPGMGDAMKYASDNILDVTNTHREPPSRPAGPPMHRMYGGKRVRIAYGPVTHTDGKFTSPGRVGPVKTAAGAELLLPGLALGGLGAIGGAGAAMAPRGHRMEGAYRALSRAGHIAGGALPGAVLGAIPGAAAGGATGSPIGTAIGAGAGALGGGVLGGMAGNALWDWSMPQPTWERYRASSDKDDDGIAREHKDDERRVRVKSAVDYNAIAANRYASRGSTPPDITGSTPGANPYRQPAAPSPSASMPNLAPMNAAVSQANRTAMDAWRRDTIAGTKNPALAAALRSLPDRSSPTSAGAPAPVSASQRPGAGVSPPPPPARPDPAQLARAGAPGEQLALAQFDRRVNDPILNGPYARGRAAPYTGNPQLASSMAANAARLRGLRGGAPQPGLPLARGPAPAPAPPAPRPVSPAATAGATLAAAPTLLPQPVQRPPAPATLPENVFAPAAPGLARPPAQTADDAMPDGIRAKSSATSLHRELSPDEEEAVATGRARFLPDLITGAGTPLPATLASPAAGGVLHGLGGAALGSAAGYGLGLLGGQPALGAAAGGLLGGAGGAAHGYLSRRRWNQDAVDLMRRLPPGATLRDYEADAGEGYPQDQLQNLRAMRYIARDLADASHNKGASLGAPVAIGTGRSLSLDLVPARKRRMNPLPGRDREEPEFFGLAGGTQATPPVDPMKGLAARRMG